MNLMRTRRSLLHPVHRPTAVRHDRHLRAVPPVADAELFAVGPEARVRAAGGPQDDASYSCTCGYVFRAAVSTSVACPHCGTGQAW